MSPRLHNRPTNFAPAIRLRSATLAVLAVLVRSDSPVLASDIRQATKLPSGTVTPALVRLEEVGVISATEDPTLRWTPPGEAERPRLRYELTEDGRAWATQQLIDAAISRKHEPSKRGRGRARVTNEAGA